MASTTALEVETDRDVMSCLYCLEEDPYLLDPRILPCAHVYCRPCLAKDFETNQVIQCPKCREVTNLTFEQLPSARSGGGHHSCAVCAKSGVLLQAAKVYCSNCCMKLCAKHEKAHNDFHIISKHELVEMDEYKKRGRHYQRRNCREHQNQPCVLGCSQCRDVFCVECVPKATLPGSCWKTGSAHQLKTLKDIVTGLSKKTTPLREQATEKYEELSALLKEITNQVANYDTETEETIMDLRQARDEQLRDIKKKYTDLEAEYTKERAENKEKITHYMDNIASSRVIELHKQILSFDATLKNSHLVDLILEHNDLEARVTRLVQEEFPTLVLKNQKQIVSAGDNRSIDRKLAPVSDIVIGQTESMVADIPEAMRLIKEVNCGDCICMTADGEDVYVGMTSGQIIKINKQGQTENFCKHNVYVVGLVTHQQRLYALFTTSPQNTINVYNLNSKTQVTSWSHAVSNLSWGSRMAIINNQLVVADVTNHSLTIYSLTGDLIGDVICPQISSHWVSVCSTNNPEVIVVSDCQSSTVFAVNLTTGAVLWTNSGITKPQGVVSYSCQHVIVTAQNTAPKLWILDVHTGHCVKELEDDQGRTNSKSFDMCVVGKTLLMARKEGQAVLYYTLN